MIDIKSIKSGFRIAKWIQEKDSFEGTTFKLNLNGRVNRLKYIILGYLSQRS